MESKINSQSIIEWSIEYASISQDGSVMTPGLARFIEKRVLENMPESIHDGSMRLRHSDGTISRVLLQGPYHNGFLAFRKSVGIGTFIATANSILDEDRPLLTEAIEKMVQRGEWKGVSNEG